jgi:putative hydrolase of the HAD superfamily
MRILGIEDCFEGVICFESIMAFRETPASRSGYATPCIQEDSATCFFEGDGTPSSSGAPSPTLDGKRSVRRESSLETLKVALRAAKAGRKSVEKSLAGLQIALGDGPPTIVCKPQPESYERALRMAGAEPGSTLYFDDSLRNISGGKAAGLATVLVKKPDSNLILSSGSDLTILQGDSEANPYSYSKMSLHRDSNQTELYVRSARILL